MKNIVFSRRKGEFRKNIKKVAQKKAEINKKQYASASNYLKQRFGSLELGFHSIVFNPIDHELVREEPSIRRSYIDNAICAEEEDYLEIIRKYQKALRQKNALLKEPEQPSEEEILGYTETLCHYGNEITLRRLQWIKKANKKLPFFMKKITRREEKIYINYQSNYIKKTIEFNKENNGLYIDHFPRQEGAPSLQLLEKAFWLKYSLLSEKERRAKTTLVGPHRDEWQLFLDSRLLKGHGSQGEIRAALLTLKLSELALYRERTGRKPVFLLDDFSSELDRERREFLLEYLLSTDLQVFITTTEDISGEGKSFFIHRGSYAKQHQCE
ncbi:MAG: DNA replication and repair protein RecF [Bdellovibrio sp.]|nr:DNA replication and repair protein RecF [Bdellovibrio sp.]